MPTLHFPAGRMPTLLLFSAKTDATPPVPDSRFPIPDSRFPRMMRSHPFPHTQTPE
ncbi:MAG: hypothetical protein F6K65_21125 [Moorea sp. SIO3C2]|nr:hypothetical protein [Moorena sp. SIO3C2]